MYRVAESLRVTHGRDGAVVLDVAKGRIVNINIVGSRVLQLLQEHYDESAIVREISTTFGVTVETSAQDVHEFLAQLKSEHLIEEL